MAEAVGNATKNVFQTLYVMRILALKRNKAKKSAKQLQSIVIDALACSYCFNASLAGKSNLIYIAEEGRGATVVL